MESKRQYRSSVVPQRSKCGDRTWSAADAWSAQSATITYAGTNEDWVIGAMNPDDPDAINSLWMIINSNSDIGALSWNGTTMTLIGVATFTADTALRTEEVFDIKLDKP